MQWMRPKKTGKGHDFEFRSVTSDDLERELIVENIQSTWPNWQAKGWVPDMRIEPGDKTDEP
jgi:putative DNA methylase